jgi:hypothetical protein
MLINVKPSEPTKAMLHHIADARLRASSSPPYTGLSTAQDQLTIRRCTTAFQHGPDIGVSLIFTRDEGMHACGWWKNPDYERCEHVSLAFWELRPGRPPLPQDHVRARLWCLGFFGVERCRYLWIEPPYSERGIERDVYHYRLFLAPDWRLPVLPRGEVYSRDFTEAGWKSWSDLHGTERLGDGESETAP